MILKLSLIKKEIDSIKFIANNDKFTIIRIYLSEHPFSKTSILKFHDLTSDDLGKYECRIQSSNNQINNLYFNLIENQSKNSSMEPFLSMTPNEDILKLKTSKSFKINCSIENISFEDRKFHFYISVLKDNVKLNF